jgi:uncharacterized membrane protein
MQPLIFLLVTTALARALGAFGLSWLDSWTDAVRVGLAAMFTLTASAHFLAPRRQKLVAMVPERLPRPEALVTLTGILELAGAVGLLIPATAASAALGLLLLLIVMFPANVRAARIPDGLRTMPLPLRTVVQAGYISACALVVLA